MVHIWSVFQDLKKCSVLSRRYCYEKDGFRVKVVDSMNIYSLP